MIFLTKKPEKHTYIELSPLNASVFSTGRNSAYYHRRNVNTKSVANSLIYIGVLPAVYARTMVLQILCE